MKFELYTSKNEDKNHGKFKKHIQRILKHKLTLLEVLNKPCTFELNLTEE